MTFDQIVGLLTARFGNRPGMAEKIEAEMVYAQREVIEGEDEFKPWFLLQGDFDDIAFSTNDEYVTLPSDFIAIADDGAVYVENTDGTISRETLYEYTYDKLRSRGWDENTDTMKVGTPEAYARVNDRLYLSPIPNYSGNVKLRMYATQELLTSKSPETHPILRHASDWLIGIVGAQLAENFHDDDKLKIFEARASRARLRVFDKSLEHDHGEGRNRGGEI